MMSTHFISVILILISLFAVSSVTVEAGQFPLNKPVQLPDQSIPLPAGVTPAAKKTPKIPAVTRTAVPLPKGLSRPLPGGIKPSTAPRLPRIDLGVRVIAARVGQRGGSHNTNRNEIEVEVVNHGPENLDRYGFVRISVLNGGDRLCSWPTNISMRISRLPRGDRETIVFKNNQIVSKRCADAKHPQPDRSNIRVAALISRRRGAEPQFADPNPSNDQHYARLSDIFIRQHTSRRPEQEISESQVRIKISPLNFKVTGTGDNSLHGMGELKWVKVKLHNASETQYDHKQISILHAIRGGANNRRKKNSLKIASGDWISMGQGQQVVATAHEGQRVTLEITARELDCANGNNCRRGNTGHSRLHFRVPRFADDFRSDCSDYSAQRKINELPNVSVDARGSPRLRIPLGSEDEAFISRVCFERIDR